MKWSKKLYAKFFEWRMRDHEVEVAPYKQKIFSGICGTVVEVGSGAGSNIKYFPKDISYIGIEPSEFMHQEFKEEAEKRKFTGYKLIVTSAEHIPLPDNSVDFVVGTLLLCSASDPDAILKEILRILKPRGKYLFLEHVVAPKNSLLYFLQKILKPLHKIRADGCNPDRKTGELIKKQKFSSVSYENFKTSLSLCAPHIAGVAIK